MKKILIINGHPDKNSYCSALCQAYLKGALSKGNDVVLLSLCDLNFDPNFTGTYSRETIENSDTDILMAREKIRWASHVVVVHPVWWGSVPALLKGFFDQALVPGFAFKYKPNSPMWDKLLKGRTAHIIYTADTPPWFNRLFYRAPSVNMVRDRVLGFCGIVTTAVVGIGPIRGSSEEFRKKWLLRVEKLGSETT